MTMTKDEAQALRAAHDTDARLLSRKPKYELTAIATMERAAAGYERLYGTSSKDELVAEILDLRGFGTARLNEAIHILHHDVTWPDCEHCQAEIKGTGNTRDDVAPVDGNFMRQFDLSNRAGIVH